MLIKIRLKTWTQLFLVAYKTFSLDVILGALASCYFAGQIFSQEIPKSWYVLLGTGCFTIYLFDLLLDTNNSKKPLPRHKHIIKHFRKALTLPIVIFGGIVSGIAFFYLPTQLLVLGGSISLWTMLYYLTNKRLSSPLRNYFPKEIFISVGYFTGVFGPAILLSGAITISQAIISFVFWILVQVNILIFSLYDAEDDRMMNWHGLLRVMNITQLNYLIYSLLLLAFLILSGLIAFSNLSLNHLNILALMTLVLTWIILDQKRWEKNRRFSYAADAVFLLPGLLFFI